MIARLQWPDWERVARIGNVADKGGGRPILESVYLESETGGAATKNGRLRAVATDSYKLATVAVDAEIEIAEPSILMPARAVRTITTAFRTQLGSKWIKLLPPDEKHISIVVDDEPRLHAYVEFEIGARYVGSLATDLVEGNFPNYRALLHKPGAELSRSTLARKRKDQIADYISVQYGRGYDPEQSDKETLLNIADDFASKPTPRAVGLNQDHLNGLMKTTTTRYPEYLRIEMFGEHRPVWFSNPADKDWLGIQMPVRS